MNTKYKLVEAIYHPSIIGLERIPKVSNRQPENINYLLINTVLRCRKLFSKKH